MGVEWSSWADLGGSNLTGIAGASNADGRQVVVGLTTAGALYHNWQTAPGNGWSGWYEFGNPDQGGVQRFALGQNSDGRLAIAAIDLNGYVWYREQTTVNQGWGGWTNVAGTTATAVAIGQNRNGFLQILVVGTGGGISTSRQRATGWTPWTSLPVAKPGVSFTKVAVASNLDGRLEVVGLLTDNSVADISQTSPNGAWSGWTDLGQFDQSLVLGDMAIGPQEGGWLTLVVSGSAGNLYYRYQQQPPGPVSPGTIVWSQWARLDPPLPGVFIGPVTLAHNGDGRLRIFGVGSDGALWQLAQAAINVPSWDPWVSLGAEAGQALAGRPAIGRNVDGRLEAFACTRGGSVAHLWERQPVSRLPWFQALVASVAPVVYLHPNELYMPASFDTYLAQTKYVDAHGRNGGPLTPASLTWPTFGAGGYLCYTWGDTTLEEGDLPSAVCYVHVRSSADWTLGGGYDIQYWFFYGFNGPGLAGLTLSFLDIGPQGFAVDTSPMGDHQGDWEHITVRVDPQGHIKQIYCSQHDRGNWYSQAHGSSEGYSLTADGHPIIYSAQYGHPSYPWAADFPTPKGGAKVEGDGVRLVVGLLNHAKRGTAWPVYEPGRHRIVAIDVPGFETFQGPWWLPYQGRCGQVDPPIGDTITEAASHMVKTVMSDGFDFVTKPILLPIFITAANILAKEDPEDFDFAGPTAPREKDAWYTGL